MRFGFLTSEPNYGKYIYFFQLYCATIKKWLKSKSQAIGSELNLSI